MTQKAEFHIQANEMNNRTAFPSCRRSVIYFTRAQWHVCFFLDVVPTPAVFTEAFSFHPAGMFIAWNVPLIIRPFRYARRDHYKAIIILSMQKQAKRFIWSCCERSHLHHLVYLDLNWYAEVLHIMLYFGLYCASVTSCVLFCVYF